MTDRLRERFPFLRWSILALCLDMLYYYVPKVITLNAASHDLTGALDRAAPFLPFFTVFYIGAFIQWGIYYLRIASGPAGKSAGYLVAEVMAKLACTFTFLVFPTSIVRPDAAGGGIFSFVLCFIYAVDAPTCLFPSIHCLMSWLSMRHVLSDRDLSVTRKTISVLFTILVCLSTVFIRQHFAADCFAGILLAEAGLALSGKMRLTGRFASRMETERTAVQIKKNK